MSNTEDFDQDIEQQEATAPPPKKSGGGFKLIVLLLAVLGGGFFGVKQGLIPLSIPGISPAAVPVAMPVVAEAPVTMPMEAPVSAPADLAVVEIPADPSIDPLAAAAPDLSSVPPMPADSSILVSADTSVDPLAPAADPLAASVETPADPLAATVIDMPSEAAVIDVPLEAKAIDVPLEAAVPAETFAVKQGVEAEQLAPPVAEQSTLPVADASTATALEARIAALEQGLKDLQASAPTKSDIDGLKQAIDRLEQASREKPAVTEQPVKSKPRAAAKPKIEKLPSVVWVLKSAKPGMAWLAEAGSSEIKAVGVGDTLPGIGKITLIAKDSGGKWVVNGTGGRVNQ